MYEPEHLSGAKPVEWKAMAKFKAEMEKEKEQEQEGAKAMTETV